MSTEPLFVTVIPVGGTERPLKIEGHPSMSWVRNLGCEKASIPAAREELDALDLQGAVVRIHGAGWWGVVIERPEPGRALSALGYGAWAGSLDRRAVLYSDNRLSSWSQWQPQGGSGGDGITPAIKTWTGSGYYIGLTRNVAVGSYANQGISFTDERTFTRLQMTWLKTKANTSYGLVVYSGNTPGVISRTEYTSTGTGATLDLPLPLDTVWVAVAAYNPGVAWTPSLGGEGIYVTGLLVTGRDMSSITTATVAEDIINAEVPDPYGVSGIMMYPFTMHTARALSPCHFEASTPNEKFEELTTRCPIEYGWYDGRHYDRTFGQACFPHIWDRPTAPAYVLLLHSLETPPGLDYARLDEMTSGTMVRYELPDGRTAAVWSSGSDLTHPLVALGIKRIGEVTIQATAAEAQLVADEANAENGRQRVRGSVTLRRGELKTTTGADADFYGVRPGEIVRLIGTPNGYVDVRIHRATWSGDLMTLELDGSGYRLDALLAQLAARR